ncbi:lactonase family protein [Marinagarivorans algicola]|uniref:lactonase family protein n=1 Tax=Marinagarivorans algicola TaxID=1513270 RepID=UPI0006B9B780|nr:beta-propeller fold lactonase family protein [Marinagarivorans algicola]
MTLKIPLVVALSSVLAACGGGTITEPASGVSSSSISSLVASSSVAPASSSSIAPVSSSSAAPVSSSSVVSSSSLPASSGASSSSAPRTPKITPLLSFGGSVFTFTYNAETMSFSEPREVSDAGDIRYVTTSNKGIIYTGGEDTVGAYTWDGTDFTQISSQPAGGRRGSGVDVHPNQKFLASSNYSTGEVVVFGLNDDGTIKDEPQIYAHGETSLPHWVGWRNDGKYLYSPFKGDDVIRKYAFDKNTGVLSPGEVAWRSEEGEAPRHMTFHPTLDVAYVLTEATSRVVVLSIQNNGSLTELQSVEALAADQTDKSGAADVEISLDGNNFYTSNRPNQTITTYSIAADGRLEVIDRDQQTIDKPRAFTVVDSRNLLFVANQGANTISAFMIGLAGELDFAAESSYSTLRNPAFIMQAKKTRQ